MMAWVVVALNALNAMDAATTQLLWSSNAMYELSPVVRLVMWAVPGWWYVWKLVVIGLVSLWGFVRCENRSPAIRRRFVTVMSFLTAVYVAVVCNNLYWIGYLDLI